MSKVNKFNADWQLVRVQARDIKEPAQKVYLVYSYLRQNPTKENAGRVLNWAQMTKLGYKSNQDALDHLNNLISYIDKTKFDISEKELTGPKVYNDEDLMKVYKDLKKRKNNFRHGGKMPKDQKAFMELLEAEIEKRGL